MAQTILGSDVPQRNACAEGSGCRPPGAAAIGVLRPSIIMNLPLAAIAKKDASASTHAGYTGADELLEDLRGDNGSARRSFAVGYLMAVQEANSDLLTGNTLLQYLRGDAGEPLRLTGVGYVMGLRDSLGAPRGSTEIAPTRDSRPQVQVDAEHVKDWLESNPSMGGKLALSLVRSVLQGSRGS